KPLYAQVKSQLLQRLIDKIWIPGEALPSEQQLANELGVSQGTVRKALDELTDENIVVRRQGRGTFVAEHTQERALFQYFMLSPDEGAKGEDHFPQSQVLDLTGGSGTHRERAALNLAANDHVWRLERNRSVNGSPLIAEKIVVPKALFERLDTIKPLPNNVYALFDQSFGQSIVRAEERLKAVGANEAVAKRLGCTPETPVLKIDRIAYAMSGKPVEWRVSHCMTDNFHYVSSLK
ncbi:MAG: GntR family transcriptional regulator, partial [Hyphomicrobiales bacterium]